MTDRPSWGAPTPRAGRRLSRRHALGLGAAAVASTVLPADPVAADRARPRRRSALDTLRPEIRPRSDWAGELAPTGEILPEDDVRFLLVHHTASTNDYGPDEIIGQIRGFYDFHTGPEKGWPDVAYNFFVDRYGGLWEARAGSIDGPVRGDATGGSQGFALLCSLIGNHVEAPMTAEQQASLVALLAWLGERYGVDTTPGATVSFTSRGSSRWPSGTAVDASTISGHRDMSTTTCPGDHVYRLLADEIPSQVTALRVAAGGGGDLDAATTTSATSAPTTSTPASSPSSSPTPASSATSPPAPTPSTTTAEEATAAATVGADADTGGGRSLPLIATGAVAGAIAAAGALVNRLRGRANPRP